jgi:hypothetical protein
LSASEQSRERPKGHRGDVRILSEKSLGRISRHESRQQEVQRHGGPDRDGKEN